MNGDNEPVDGSKYPPAFITQFDYHSQPKQKGAIMNPDPMLDKAEIAMLSCTDHSAYRYFLYELRGSLFCGPALSIPEDANRIYPLSRHDLLFGPDLTGWTVMRDELTKHERSRP